MFLKYLLPQNGKYSQRQKKNLNNGKWLGES